MYDACARLYHRIWRAAIQYPRVVRFVCMMSADDPPWRGVCRQFGRQNCKAGPGTDRAQKSVQPCAPSSLAYRWPAQPAHDPKRAMIGSASVVLLCRPGSVAAIDADDTDTCPDTDQGEGLTVALGVKAYGRALVFKYPLDPETKREVGILAARGRYQDAVTRAGRDHGPSLLREWWESGRLTIPQLKDLLPDVWVRVEFPTYELSTAYRLKLFKEPGFVTDTPGQAPQVTPNPSENTPTPRWPHEPMTVGVRGD